jgi:vacuolar protein sorting-associated protein VTA1
MLSSSIPTTLKSLKRFFKRAEELDRAAASGQTKPAVVAYFCRSYALQLGLKLHKNLTGDEAETAMNFLLDTMTNVEAAKATLPKYDGEKAKEFCTQFALSVFKRADDEDRAGMADKNTARTFYAAATFLDMLLQFGPLDESIKQVPLYAKYKSTDIVKALKEGRTPTAGPPGGDPNDVVVPDGGKTDTATGTGTGGATTNTATTNTTKKTQPNAPSVSKPTPTTPSLPSLPQQPVSQPTPTPQPIKPTPQPIKPTPQPTPTPPSSQPASSSSSTSTQKQQPRESNIALDMAIEMVKEAIKQDHAGNYPQAFRLYKECLGYFMDAIKCTSNPASKKTIMARMDAYMKRAEVLKKSGKV